MIRETYRVVHFPVRLKLPREADYRRIIKTLDRPSEYTLDKKGDEVERVSDN